MWVDCAAIDLANGFKGDANKDPPPAATTVVRVTKGGETATATYDLVIIPSMKNLKQSSPLHTTVTGDATVVTVAAQVFAGGVAWVYSGSQTPLDLL